jgi:hypothetical protein
MDSTVLIDNGQDAIFGAGLFSAFLVIFSAADKVYISLFYNKRIYLSKCPTDRNANTHALNQCFPTGTLTAESQLS